jgi:hypothetical protein
MPAVSSDVERADPHDLALAGAAARRRNADHLAGGIDFAGGRQAVALAGGHPLLSERSAQGRLHALRNGGEMGLAVERGENGATHQGRAAQAGQDGAREPLYGDAPAIDVGVSAAVDRQGWFVAEVERG